jgi:hypothetical protein
MLRHFLPLALFSSLSTLSASPAGDIKEKPFPAQAPSQITYLSDKDDAYKYLEGQQREIYEGNPELADPFSREELTKPRAIANLAELRARALRACPDSSKRDTCALDPMVLDQLLASWSSITLPTRFESPIFISMINLYTEELETVRKKLFPTSSIARFGSLPTGTIDAQTILPVGSKDPVVILNRDIFFFTGALSKSISDAIPIHQGRTVSLDYSEEGIRKRLRDHAYIVANFADAMSRMVSVGSSAGAIEVTLDEDHNHIHARLVTAMDRFIIAHEEAHVILRHVSNKSVQFHLAGGHAKNRGATVPFSRPNGSGRRESLQQAEHLGKDSPTILMAQLRTRKQELEADALGFKLTMWVEQNGNDPIAPLMAAAAPHMVFRIFDAANSFGREAGGWTFSDANHPPAADRINALSSVFNDLAKRNGFLRQVDFRIPFDAAFKVLLAEADPQIRQNLGLPTKPGSGHTR